MKENMAKTELPEKEIIRTWLAGHSSCTLVTPKEFAKQYGLDKPSHVIVEKKNEGILIRRNLNVEEAVTLAGICKPWANVAEVSFTQDGTQEDVLR